MPTYNAHRWLAEPLLNRADCEAKRMFGAEAFYLGGRLVLVTADKDPAWAGCLFPAERDQHAAILADYPQLVPHTVLPKWLWLCERHDQFEDLAKVLIRRCLDGDPRFGVIPPPKKKKGTAKKATKASDDAPAAKALADGRPPHLG